MHYSQLADPEQTIAAISSAAGTGGRGMIRMSGDETLTILQQLCQRSGVAPEFDRKTARRYSVQLAVGERGVPFPVDLFLWPQSRSYTGQPAAELHTLGSPPLLEKLLSLLFELGARPARAGEFTLRSFLARKISLVQAEAVLGVIDARSDAQLETALSQLAGGISARMRQMRDQLLDDLADLEAGLDFVEEDIEFIHRPEFCQRLQQAVALTTELCRAAEMRMHSSSAVRIVLAGLPNAGKSSLFNRLTGERALVSEIQGTTTDYLTGTLTLSGQPVQLLDTAGWETGQAGIGELAQQFREENSQRASLILWCTAADLTATEREQETGFWQQVQSWGLPCWRILTKADRLTDGHGSFPDFPVSPVSPTEEPSGLAAGFQRMVSANSEESVEELKSALTVFLQEHQAGSQEFLGSTAARCYDSLQKTREHLEQAVNWAERGLGDEFLAEEMRAAIQELGVILGHVYTDDLLDRVFSKFCIGK